MASMGWISMMMFRIRLSRIQNPTKASMIATSRTVSQTGQRRASTNPAIMAKMSETELMTLSP